MNPLHLRASSGFWASFYHRVRRAPTAAALRTEHYSRRPPAQINQIFTARPSFCNIAALL